MIFCPCDDFLDHSTNLSRSYADLLSGEGKILPPFFRGIASLTFGSGQKYFSDERQVLTFKASKGFRITVAPLKSGKGLQCADRNKISLTCI